MTLRRTFTFLLASLLLVVLSPGVAVAAVNVTRAELDGAQLRVEGTGAVADATITVDGVAMGSADGAGSFRIEREPFSSKTCRVTVSDGTSSTTAALSGCTPTNGTPAAPTFLLAPTTGKVGDVLEFQARGTDPDGDPLAFTFSFAEFHAGELHTARSPATGFLPPDPATGASTSGVVSHQWFSAGTYSVNVKATDEPGDTGPIAFVTVVIENVPATPPPQNDCGTGADAGGTLDTATPITLPVTCTGRLVPEEHDVYAITVPPGQEFELLTVQLDAFTEGADLWDPDGNVQVIVPQSFRSPRVVNVCETTPCRTNLTGYAFGYTLDRPGTWKLDLRPHVVGFAREMNYTLHVHLGGGGGDCAASRDGAFLPPQVNDAPGFFNAMALAHPVDCVGAHTAADVDTNDRYLVGVLADEPVAISILPAVPTHPFSGAVQARTTFPGATPTGPTGEVELGLAVLLSPSNSGNALLELNAFPDGQLPTADVGYRVLVATGSRHVGDCFTGADAGATFAAATAMFAPACVGDLGPGDTEDWLRFDAALGEEIFVFRTPDGERSLGTVPVEVYDPDGVRRGGPGSYVIDKAGAWRLRVAAQVPGQPTFTGAYGVRLLRKNGEPAHDCGSGADAPAAGLPIPLPTSCRGDFMPFLTDSADDYRFDVQGGQRVSVTLTSNPYSQFKVKLVDPTGTVRASAFSHFGEPATLTFDVDVTGTWRARVEYFLLDAVEVAYGIEVSATTPVVTEPKVSVAVEVPAAADTGDSVRLGQTFTVDVKVSNAGATAQNTTVTLSWAPSGAVRLESPKQATVSAGDLAQGQLKTFSWSVRTKQVGSVTLTGTAKNASGAVLGSGQKILSIRE